MKAIIVGTSPDASSQRIHPLVIFYNADGSVVDDQSTGSLDTYLVNMPDQASFVAAVEATIAAYASAHSYTVTETVWVPFRAQALARTFASPSRSLNSAFQISTIQDAQVNYSVDIATAVSLAGGAVGTVFLEYADNSGFTTNVVEVGRFVNGQTGTLVIGLTLNQTNTAGVGGLIPAGKYVRIRTANTTGTPTFTFRSAQEVLI